MALKDSVEKRKSKSKEDKSKKKPSEKKTIPQSNLNFTLEEACQELHVGEQALRGYVNAGLLPVYKEKFDTRGKTFKRFFLKKDITYIKAHIYDLVKVELNDMVVEEVELESDDNDGEENDA